MMGGLILRSVVLAGKTKESIGLNEDVIENEDGSVFVNQLQNVSDFFEEKRELLRLAKNISNQQFKQKKVVSNINQMKQHDIDEFDSVMKSVMKPMKSNYKIAIQYKLLNLDYSDQKWNIVQVIFNQKKISLITNIIFKKLLESQTFLLLTNMNEYENSDGLFEDKTISIRQFEQDD